MDIINLVSTVIVIVATIINLYFVYKSHALTQKSETEKKPVIDIKLELLPPYTSNEQKTILKLKNVGNKGTGTDPLVILSCSWMPSVSYKLNFPSDGHTLFPNEEIIWKFRIDEHFSPNSIVKVTVYDRPITWELHEQI